MTSNYSSFLTLEQGLAGAIAVRYPDPASMNPQEKIKQMLAHLWEEHRSEIQARVEIIAEACAAVRSGTLTEKQRLEAHSAAHKLAGVLGTFGRQEGTDLARTIEKHFAPENGDSLNPAELNRAVESLRQALS